jgi:hypothetical protein
VSEDPTRVLPRSRARPLPNLPALVQPAARALRPTPGVVRAAPNVAKVAVTSAWKLASWGLGTTLASANYVVRRAADGESASAIMQDAAHDLRDAAWRALGLGEVATPTRPLPGPGTPLTPEDLQQRGSDLLRRSNDVRVVEDTHPAFARILTEITPDEARILRFLYLEGPQPSVDVRTRRPFGIGSVLVAQGLTMVAEQAGCRTVDRMGMYLTNLSRLGLVDLSPEQVSNPDRYQVVEAQPNVTQALKQAGRWPRTIHRSILLTAFGTEFVVTCLPLNGRVVQRRELGSHDITQ